MTEPQSHSHMVGLPGGITFYGDGDTWIDQHGHKVSKRQHELLKALTEVDQPVSRRIYAILDKYVPPGQIEVLTDNFALWCIVAQLATRVEELERMHDQWSNWT